MKFEPIDSTVIMCCLFISVLWIPTLSKVIKLIKENKIRISFADVVDNFKIWLFVISMIILFTVVSKTISLCFIFPAVYQTIDLGLTVFAFNKKETSWP